MIEKKIRKHGNMLPISIPFAVRQTATRQTCW